MTLQRPQQSGFSLVEILAVVFVIVLLTSMVTFNVGTGGRDIEVETQMLDLVDTARYALDEAQFTGLDYGLLVEQQYTPEGPRSIYRWQERRVDGWQEPVSGKEIFASRALPPGVAFELEIEQSPFSETELEEEEVQHPQIVMYSSGETTVGAINVRQEETGELLWRIEWDLLGRFELLHRGEAAEEE